MNITVIGLTVQIVVAVLVLLTLVVMMIKLRGMSNGGMGSLVEAMKVILNPLFKSIATVQQDIRDVHTKMDKKFMTKEMCQLSHESHDREHTRMEKDLNGFGKRVARVEKKII
jgi:hypothetical protein